MMHPTPVFFSFLFSTRPLSQSETIVDWLSLPQSFHTAVYDGADRAVGKTLSVLSACHFVNSSTLTTRQKKVKILQKKKKEKEKKKSYTLIRFSEGNLGSCLKITNVFSQEIMKNRYSWEWFWGLGVGNRKKGSLFTSYPLKLFHCLTMNMHFFYCI